MTPGAASGIAGGTSGIAKHEPFCRNPCAGHRCAERHGRGGRTARRPRFRRRRGGAAARRGAWRHGDQCRDGAGQARRDAAARHCRDAGRPAEWPGRHHLGRGGGAGVPEPAASARKLAGRGPCRFGRRPGLRAFGAWPRHQGQRRIRLGQPDGADACRPCSRCGLW